MQQLHVFYSDEFKMLIIQTQISCADDGTRTRNPSVINRVLAIELITSKAIAGK